ncbi:hypothetical protein [Halalkalibacter alkalisediminis]|uniref:ABC transporter permease n=1 Tax=Halalkalibacter alkalisediminis TaxID=935616 RepID=A0ABV6NN73_9BACI|nr:hypothetical protein [Halalkalibacter alkalisediminis]
MNEKRQLIKFFVSSFYRRPKQPMLQVVLIIAAFYMFVQLTVVNLAVFLLGNTPMFMFYNLLISSVLIFALVCYFSISQVFAYYEFNMLVPLPLSAREIITAKVISSLWVPMVISMLVQIPTLVLLLIEIRIIEAMKLLLFIPIVNVLTALLLLFLLSIVNTQYYRFKNKVDYLAANMAVILLVLIGCLVYFSSKMTVTISTFLSQMDVTSIEGLLNSVEFVLLTMYETFNNMALISLIVTSFTTLEQMGLWVVMLSFTILISILLYYIVIKICSFSYVKNGVSEQSETSLRPSRVRITNSQWVNYLQRELWIIQSEAYFKMQIALGLLLPPIGAVILLVLVQKDVFPSYFILSNKGFLGSFFSYVVLFLCCINNISGTPYSREGKYHYLLKSAPFNKNYVYFSKVVISSIMSIMAILVSYLILALFGFWEFESIALLLTITSLVICYNLLTPLYDMKKPSLDWENPAEAIKSNPNVLISLLYGLPILILIIAVHFSLIWFVDQSFIATIITLLLGMSTLLILIKKVKLVL